MANFIDPGNKGQERRFERHHVRGEARLEPLDESNGLEAPFMVMLQDIARTGVMFQSPQPLVIGTQWRINFLHKGHRLGTCPLVVSHCQQVRPGFYLIGAQFMIEPIVLSALGVKSRDLLTDDLRNAQQLLEATMADCKAYVGDEQA